MTVLQIEFHLPSGLPICQQLQVSLKNFGILEWVDSAVDDTIICKQTDYGLQAVSDVVYNQLKTVSSGTPDAIYSDLPPFTTTIWILVCKKSLIHSRIYPFMPQLTSSIVFQTFMRNHIEGFWRRLPSFARSVPKWPVPSYFGSCLWFVEFSYGSRVPVTKIAIGGMR